MPKVLTIINDRFAAMVETNATLRVLKYNTALDMRSAGFTDSQAKVVMNAVGRIVNRWKGYEVHNGRDETCRG